MPHARSAEARARRAGWRSSRRMAVEEAAREARVQALQAAGASRPDGPVPYLLASTAASAGSPRGTRVPAPALTGWLQGGRAPTEAERDLIDAAGVRVCDGAGHLTPAGEEWLLLQQRRAPALSASRRRAEEADEGGPLSDHAQAAGDEAQRDRAWRAAGDWARQLAAGSGISRRAGGAEYARVPAAGAVDEGEQEERRALMSAAKHQTGRLQAGGTILVPTGGRTVAEAVEEARLLEGARRERVAAARRASRGYTTIWPLAWSLAAGAAVACVALVVHLR